MAGIILNGMGWDGMGLNRRLKENDNIMQWNNKMGWNEKEWK